jgi:GNAT superfamily N-acetyltransferase
VSIRIIRLKHRHEAAALTKCVYATYGLTFHRSYLYDPDRTLRLNQDGHLTSFLAMDGDVCVGHMALIRPYYEYSEAGTPVVGDRIREAGLSMVHPDYRTDGLQARLSAHTYKAAVSDGFEGLVARCVTHHTAAQRACLTHGGVATAMFLGGIPAWVRYGEEHDGGQPITTVGFFMPMAEGRETDVYLPRIDRDIYERIYDRLPGNRRFRSAEDAPDMGQATELRVHFDPQRQQGRIHVLRAGPDVEERVTRSFNWLMAGHIRHVTVLAPLDSPHTARAVPSWKGHGCVFGGVLPSMGTGDVLMLQGIRLSRIDPDAIRVADPLGTSIRERCVDDWYRVQHMAMPVMEGEPEIAMPSAVL